MTVSHSRHVSGPEPQGSEQGREEALRAAQTKFEAHPDITSRELFEHARSLAGRFGWEWGGPIAGHLIGHFPHERIPNDKISLYVHPDSGLRMRSLDADGRRRHWILEIHFVDRERAIGGFFEELLTIS